MARKKTGQPNGRRDDTQTPNSNIAIGTMPFRISRFGDIVAPNPTYREPLETDRRLYNPTRSIAPLRPKDAARIVVKSTINARQQYKRAHLLIGSPVKYHRRKAGLSTLSERLSFNAPKRLELCIRRAIRTQVLHAKRKTGQKGQKRPNRNYWSKISC